MLGRKDYTQAEYDNGRTIIKKQMAAYKKLAGAAARGDEKAQAALKDFDGQFFNSMVLLLDRLYIHRIRPVAGKDGTPLNEVELICDALLTNGGVMRTNNVIKYIPEQSVTKLKAGDKIRLTGTQFEKLSAAFFEELKSKFVKG